jgi:diacylglycerol kinase family enzyme
MSAAEEMAALKYALVIVGGGDNVVGEDSAEQTMAKQVRSIPTYIS